MDHIKAPKHRYRVLKEECVQLDSMSSLGRQEKEKLCVCKIELIFFSFLKKQVLVMLSSLADIT